VYTHTSLCVFFYFLIETRKAKLKNIDFLLFNEFEKLQSTEACLPEFPGSVFPDSQEPKFEDMKPYIEYVSIELKWVDEEDTPDNPKPTCINSVFSL